MMHISVELNLFKHLLLLLNFPYAIRGEKLSSITRELFNNFRVILSLGIGTR